MSVNNLILTPLEILQHIEELQKSSLDDSGAWKTYHESLKTASATDVRKAEEYKEKNNVTESVDNSWFDFGGDIFTPPNIFSDYNEVW